MSCSREVVGGVSGANQECWNKVKPVTEAYSELCHEFAILKHLQACPFVPLLLSTEVLVDGASCWFSMQRAKGKALPECEGLNDKVCDKIYEAIQAIHELGVVHSDLKGDHIFVAEDGKVTIIDFDMARFVTDLQMLPPLGHLFRGSLLYASTLTHMGYAPSFASDFETLGFVIFEWTLGRLPWYGINLPEQVDQVTLINEVGIVKLRWLSCSTNALAVELYQYVVSGCPQSLFRELPQRLSAHAFTCSFYSADSEEEEGKETEQQEEVDKLQQQAKRIDVSDEALPVCVSAGTPEDKFRAELSKALGTASAACLSSSSSSSSSSSIDIISCEAKDLRLLKENKDWYVESLPVSAMPSPLSFSSANKATKNKLLLEVGVVSQARGEAATTNLIAKIDQLHSRLEALLGSDHPLSLVGKVAYVGIGIIQATTDSPDPETLGKTPASDTMMSPTTKGLLEKAAGWTTTTDFPSPPTPVVAATVTSATPATKNASATTTAAGTGNTSTCCASSVPRTTKELLTKAAVHVARKRGPADWVMAAVGRYLFLSPLLPDGGGEGVEEDGKRKEERAAQGIFVSGQFQLVSALSSQGDRLHYYSIFPCSVSLLPMQLLRWILANISGFSKAQRNFKHIFKEKHK